MIDLTIHHLWFTVEAATPLALPAAAGSAIRGALIGALRRHYCPDASLRPVGSSAESDAQHRAICPVCWLIASEDEAATRGRNVQRPYTIEPPVGPKTTFEPGEPLSFGVSLVGQAINLFPYLVLAVPEMGRAGLGAYDPGRGGRGRFTLRAVTAVNPLTGERQPLLAGGTQLRLPSAPVGDAQVRLKALELADAARAVGNRLAVEFCTPTRIVAGAHLVRQPTIAPVFHRLLERVDGLRLYAAGSPTTDEAAVRLALLGLADQVELVEDDTTWVEMLSGSRRLGRATPVSGFRGSVTYRSAHWDILLPWLLWGQSLHVGKNAVKGDGWFTVDGCPGWPERAAHAEAQSRERVD